MNENLDLVKLLKDCPKGTEFYSTVYGECILVQIHRWAEQPIHLKTKDNIDVYYKKDGLVYKYGECTLFPSKEQRDWSKFKFKKPKFDPKTFKPFDRVLCRDDSNITWNCAFFSHIKEDEEVYKFQTHASPYKYCIPYNDDTKHLVGTKEEAPEYYRYWEE